MFHTIAILIFLIVLFFGFYVFNNAIKEYKEIKQKEKNGETINKDEKDIALFGVIMCFLCRSYCFAYIISYLI